MYFNCTQVNRQTVLSECLEEMETGMKKSLEASEAPSSPNFGEEEKDARRYMGTGRYQCTCVCRECRLTNLVEAHKHCRDSVLQTPAEAK